MRWREPARFGPRAPRTALGLALVVLGVAVPEGSPASSFGDAAPEPGGRVRVVLNAREAVLHEQADRARRVARARGLMLYRVLRLAALERRAAPAAAGPRLGGRAVALGTAVLERDLAEARALHQEWERVRGARGALAAPAVAAVEAGATELGRPPTLVPPVAGTIVAPFGMVRDPATSAWWFRSAVVLTGRPGELVRSPVGGRVVRVAPSLSGGEAIAIEAAAAGWSVIVSNLAVVSVTKGQALRPGEPVGRAEAGAATTAASIYLEVWRGRVPVDPAALLGR